MDPRVTSENKGLEHVHPYSLKDNGIPLGYQLSFFERGAGMEPLNNAISGTRFYN